MSGICGIINFKDKLVRESEIRKMMHIMKHRGPDGEGLFLEEIVGFGFVNLKIIDFNSSVNQPIVSADKRYILIYDGQIFNYSELKNELRSIGYIFSTDTDAEILLNSYIEWGEECLHKFNGMWAFVIYDLHKKSIFAARDRYGMKPFYYYQTDEYFAFASEIPPLLSLFKHKPDPDYQSIFDYLVFNRTDQTERTFFDKIRKLQHGHKLVISFVDYPEAGIHQSQVINHHFDIVKWYDIGKKASVTRGFKDPGQFRELLSISIGQRLRSDKPVGVCLSGGLDSSSIVSLLLKGHETNKVLTFSAVYGKRKYGDESEFINEFKPFLKNMFFAMPSADSLYDDIETFIRAHAEPVPSTGVYAQYKVMELASEKVVVTLDGQGADEALAGYHYFFGYFFKNLMKQWHLSKLSSEVYYYLMRHKNIFGLTTLLYFLLPENLKTRLRISEKGYLNSEFINEYKGASTVTKNLYSSDNLKNALIEHFEYKLEHLLKWADRNSMWFSLEARAPFLDHRLVEKTLATSEDFLIKKGYTKTILRESMRGILPEKIRRRTDKIGFGTPQDEWFRHKVWEKVVQEFLSSNTLKSRNIINTNNAKVLYYHHLHKRKNISKEIWKWINLEMWFRYFID